MVWFKIDDGLPTSRKVLAIPRRNRMAAIGLWSLAGAWAAKELTDGFVPEWLPEELGASPILPPLLVGCGLWKPTEGGWNFHDWADHQPSKASVLEERAEHARRQKEYRERKKREREAARQAARSAERDAQRDGSVTHNVTVTSDDSDASRDGGVTTARPDPTRPDPTVVPTELPMDSSSASKRGSRIPSGWRPTEEMILKAKDEFPSVDVHLETDAFCDWWRAKAGKDAVKLDWNLTWQGWMRRTHQRNLKQQPNRNPAQRYYGKPGERKAMY